MGLAYFMLDHSRKEAESCMDTAFTYYLVRIIYSFSMFFIFYSFSKEVIILRRKTSIAQLRLLLIYTIHLSFNSLLLLVEKKKQSSETIIICRTTCHPNIYLINCLENETFEVALNKLAFKLERLDHLTCNNPRTLGNCCR